MGAPEPGAAGGRWARAWRQVERPRAARSLRGPAGRRAPLGTAWPCSGAWSRRGVGRVRRSEGSGVGTGDRGSRASAQPPVPVVGSKALLLPWTSVSSSPKPGGFGLFGKVPCSSETVWIGLGNTTRYW